MSSAWISSKLGDIITTSSGGTPNRSNEEFYNGTVPWIKTGELKNKYIFEAEEYITEEAIKKSSAKVFPKNTVLLAMYGATIGNCSILTTKSSTNQACCAFLPSGKIDQEFLFYKFNYEKNRIIALGAGGAQPNISQKILKDYTINYPPRLYEQQRIAAILSSVDEAIEKTEQIIEQTETMKKGVMQELLTKGIGHTEFKETPIGQVPEDWDVKKLIKLLEDHVITSHLDGNHGSLYPRSSEFVDQGIPYLSANCINLGEVNFSNAKYLTSERASIFKKGVAINNDVLFAHNATVGPTAVLKTKLPYVILSTTLTYYRCNEEKINPYYLSYYLESQKFVLQYTRVMSQSTRNQVPITTQRNFYIVLPTLKEQKEIVKIISSINEKIINEKEILKDLTEIKKGLMQQLLTGKTRVKVDDSEEATT